MSAGSAATQNFRATDWQISFLTSLGHDVDFSASHNNQEKIERLLKSELYYDNRRKRYWPDGENNNCFAIYARGLCIDNSHHWKYCQWLPDGKSGVEVAKKTNATWLNVEGTFDTRDLSRGVRYKVSFLTKMDPPRIVEQQVKLKLFLRGQAITTREAKLPATNDSWYELEAGEFEMTDRNVGELKFVMEKRFTKPITGLLIKGVEIKAMPN